MGAVLDVYAMRCYARNDMNTAHTAKPTNNSIAHCCSVSGFLSDNRADTTLVAVLVNTGLGLGVLNTVPGLKAPVRSGEPSEQTRMALTRTWYSDDGARPVKLYDVSGPE